MKNIFILLAFLILVFSNQSQATISSGIEAYTLTESGFDSLENCVAVTLDTLKDYELAVDSCEHLNHNSESEE